MALPVSMEDPELFPKLAMLRLDMNTERQFDGDTFRQMHESLPDMWWSRLVIATRGYLINYSKEDEERLFLLDDAFIGIHQALVSNDSIAASQLVQDVHVIVGVTGVSELLENLAQLAPQSNPFYRESTRDAFKRVFGEPNDQTFHVAERQKRAFFLFAQIYSILQDRWKKLHKEKKRGIHFEEDPEWQPDDRVVLFEQFFQGNRTWILTDFDRHVLLHWRPRGASVIFGDRYIQKQLGEGFHLCGYCGMVEQQLDQFPSALDRHFCSQRCLNDFEQSQRAGTE